LAQPLTFDELKILGLIIDNIDPWRDLEMETELARTFLTVVAAGNFISAAQRLHVTQSTVSARIHTLEEQLGCTLLVRNKAGTKLTAAGRQFQKHASILVRTVERARQDIGIAAGFKDTIAVGGRLGLWEKWLLEWLPMMRKIAPDISVRAEVGLDEDLMHGLVEGRLDIGVMYTPQSRPGLTVERILEELLVLVSTEKDSGSWMGEGYVYIDWGAEFYMQHSVHFPNYAGASVVANNGWLGLQHILRDGGSGYFPFRLVAIHCQEHRLHRRLQAPEFRLPAYAVYPDEQRSGAVRLALDTMRQSAASGSSAVV
jgi:DNA-binding transcriptional LysR family regulator